MVRAVEVGKWLVGVLRKGHGACKSVSVVTGGGEIDIDGGLEACSCNYQAFTERGGEELRRWGWYVVCRWSWTIDSVVDGGQEGGCVTRALPIKPRQRSGIEPLITGRLLDVAVVVL